MKIELNEWQCRFILEALRALDEKWTSIVNSTDDENVQSDYGNDLAQLQILQEGFQSAACKDLGSHVMEFSRGPFSHIGQ